ncbi:MAG: alpha/beta hydrolase [Clostridia bacterium]|nr:alpha/beta hydrolase [Clostridia bacterium]
MTVFLTVTIIAAALLLLILAFAAYYMYRFATVRLTPVSTVWEDDELFYRFRRSYEKCPPAYMEKRDVFRKLGKSGRRLSIASRDGLKLSARLILPEGDVKGALIMFHGYRSEPTHDFGPLGSDLLKMGLMLLVPDQRAHGGSEGRHITFGVKERYDAVLWAETLSEMYPDVSIGLYGLSMGAATVTMAAELPLPPNVKAVIADCGYTSPLEICEKVMVRDMHLPKFPLFPVSRLMIRLAAGFDFCEASSVDAIRKAPLPCLIIHGEKDGFVPFKMGEALRDAADGKCTFFSVPEADHGNSYLYAPNEYTQTIRRFLHGVDINI